MSRVCENCLHILSLFSVSVKYKVPSPFFSSNPKLAAIGLALQNFLLGVTVESAELANMNSSLDVRTTWLNCFLADLRVTLRKNKRKKHF